MHTEMHMETSIHIDWTRKFGYHVEPEFFPFTLNRILNLFDIRTPVYPVTIRRALQEFHVVHHHLFFAHESNYVQLTALIFYPNAPDPSFLTLHRVSVLLEGEQPSEVDHTMIMISL